MPAGYNNLGRCLCEEQSTLVWRRKKNQSVWEREREGHEK